MQVERRIGPLQIMNRPGTAPRALAAAALTLLLAGCAAGPSAAPSAAEDTGPFVPLDRIARAAVSCTAYQERELADGRLDVAADLRNEGGSPVRVRVQCVFRDAGGLPAGAAPWRTLALGAFATETVRFTAEDARARQFSIRVRETSEEGPKRGPSLP
jgi:hypothetical protein